MPSTLYLFSEINYTTIEDNSKKFYFACKNQTDRLKYLIKENTENDREFQSFFTNFKKF